LYANEPLPGLEYNMNRTDRLLAIVLELQAKGWQRAEDLAATFEISKRTIYRDMEALAESGIPVVSSPGQGYSLVEGYFLPPLHFSADEATILLLGADFMARSFDIQYQKSAHSAASKIQVALSEKRRDEVQGIQSRMRFVALNPSANTTRPEVLQQIRRAVIENRTVRMDYHTRHGDDVAGTKSTREADPYGLLHHDRAWYMIAYCHLRHDTRNFRLDRIDRLQILDKSFKRPADFSLIPPPDDTRTIIVRALFDPEVARWIREEPSFFTTSMEDCPDGLLVTFAIRHPNDILNWLLCWGRYVRILEPESLMTMLVEEAQAVVNRYQFVLP
jgi:predicted DNA-binding transcriptional regulator YafY